MFRNFLWAFIEKGGQYIFQFISVVILSRVLSPEDFGVYGTMMIFIAISELLIDSGFGGALVQQKKITNKDINTLFVTNFSISLFLYLLLFLLAPIIADYYEIPMLVNYLRILGLVIILYSLSIVHITLLQRELKFRQTSIVVLISSVISVASATLAATGGLGVWALVIQQLSLAFVMVVVLNLIEKRKIRIQFSKSSFRKLWGFGSKLLVANLLHTVYNNISSSLVPKIASMNIAGNYVQASRINSIPINVVMSTIDKVAFPLLSREKEEALLGKAKNINRIVITICLPLFPILSLLSEEIIYIVLGQEWLDAANFLSILAWGGIGLLLQTLYRNVFKSMAKTSSILKVDIFKTFCGLIILGLSLKLGMSFLIYGLTFSMFIGAFFYIILLNVKNKVSIYQLICDFIKPLFISLILYVICKVYMQKHDFSLFNIIISILYYLSYILLNLLFRNNAMIVLLNYLGNKLKTK